MNFFILAQLHTICNFTERFREDNGLSPFLLMQGFGIESIEGSSI